MPYFVTARHIIVALCAGALLAGCTSPPPLREAPSSTAQLWSGRLGLQINDPMAAEQSFSASFQLQGSAQQGSFDIYSPLGSQLAQLEWQPGAAQLRQGSQITPSASLSELLVLSLGTDLPIDALFHWLQGIPAPAPGWQVDLRRHAEGRITALRTEPLPQASLRLILH